MKKKYLIILLFLIFTLSQSRAQTALNFVEVVKDNINGVTGLSGVSDIAVSADGKFVYSAAYGSSSVACFERDVLTGKLTFKSVIKENNAGITGLAAVFSIAVSSDNKSVYVASPTTSRVTSFSRNTTTGALTFVNTLVSNTNGMTLNGFVSVYVSPDGKWVYGIAASGTTTSGLGVFSRDTQTGAITFVEQHLHGVDGNLLGQDFNASGSPIKNIATSADGKFLYVTATLSNTVSVYSIDQITGRLTLVAVYRDGANGVDGLQGASSLLLSPDGKHLYVSGQKEHSIAVFSVNQTTGTLTYLNKLTNNTGGITSLQGVRSLAINPDGKYLYASAITSHAVTAFSRDVSTGGLSLNTSLVNGFGGIEGVNAPSGMMMDPLSRNLYVSGQSSASIVVFESSVPAVVLSSNEVTTSNNVAVILDPALDIKDADSHNLRSATVKITNGMSADLLSVNVQGGVSGIYIGATKTLSLVGTASLSQYIDILRSLSYTPSLDPSVTPGTISYRTISVSVVDEENNASAEAVISVKINPQNTVQMITFPAIANKTYGDPDFNIIAQSSNPLQAITYASSDVNIAEIVSGQIKIKKAGTVTITATQIANSGFDAAVPVSQTLTVDKASLSITAEAKSKVYGAAVPTLTYSYNGLVNGDIKVTTGPTIATTATLASVAGTYPITLSGGADANYEITLANGTLTVDKAPLSITADAKSKVYGAAVPTLTYSYNGLVNGDTKVATVPTIATTVTVASATGTYPITLNGGTDANYEITLANGTLTVDKAPLSITADAKSKVYGAAVPTLTYSYNGLVNGDTKVATVPTIATTATLASAAGTYPITLTGGTDTNYEITLANGTLTVDKAPLSITADAKSKVYGEAVPTLTFSYDGLVNGDTEVATLPTIGTTATVASVAGTYPITLTGGTDANYEITLANGTLTVDKAPLSITADAKSKVYGAAVPMLTFSYDGLVNGDTKVAIVPTIATTATAASAVGTYPITLTGGTDTNYEITLANGTLTVDKAPLSITADAKSKVYGAAVPTLTYSYDGLVNGDTKVATVPTIATTATAASAVGTYPITLTGGTDANYKITLTNGTLTVDKAPLSITAEAKSKVYGAAVPTLTYSYNGLVNGDTKVATVPTIATTATAASAADTYPITLTGGTDANYKITLTNGTLTVDKAPLSITADAKSKVYGEAVPTLTYSYDGLVNGDTKVATVPAISTTATVASATGTYPITLTGGTDANYEITLANATLTVDKAPLSITAYAKSKVYGAAVPTLTYSYDGLVNGDTKVATVPTIATTATAASAVGTYPITITGGTDANYEITLANGILTVDKAVLTIKADAKSKVYGAAVPTLTYSYDGLVNGD
ncbi:MBG domain-containing protein, partial [Sphingobacterium tabacisoli]